MRKLKKYAAIAVAAILAVLALAYFATPHHISVPDGVEIRATCVEPTLEVVDMNSVAYMESAEYKFLPGDEGYDELVRAIESVIYRNCFKTLFGSDSVSNIGYVVYVWIGDECYGFYDRGYVMADKIYYVSENDVENIRGVIM